MAGKDNKKTDETPKGVPFEVEGKIPGFLEDGVNMVILKTEGQHHSCLLTVEEPDYLLGLLSKEKNVVISNG